MSSKQIVIISYHFVPYRGVGVQRPEYWHYSFLEDGIPVNVITSTIRKNTEDKSVTVKFSGYKPVLWTLLLALSILKTYALSKKRIFIITGGPFAPMILAPLLRILGNKVILDFRDPYARNPLHRVGRLRKIFKACFEFVVCRFADKVIVVNDVCAQLILARKSRIVVIDNGFDDRISLDDKPAVVQGRIGYAGKLGLDRDLEGFISILHKNNISSDIVYIGSDLGIIESKYRSHVNNLGWMSKKDVIHELSKCNYLLLLHGGEDFESSTKIFDYIQLNKPILPYPTLKKSSRMYQILSDSKKGSFKGLFDTYHVDIDVSTYSRLYGYNKLKKIILEWL